MQLSSLLTDQDLKDILTTAIEGGSNYWLTDGYRISVTREPKTELTDPVAITIRMDESDPDNSAVTPVNGRIELDSLRKAIDLIGDNPKWIRLTKAIVEERGAIDADDADTVLQFATFEELVYG